MGVSRIISWLGQRAFAHAALALGLPCNNVFPSQASVIQVIQVIGAIGIAPDLKDTSNEVEDVS
jgi:hypothetical protein